MNDSRPALKGGNQYVLPGSVCSPHLTSQLCPAALKACTWSLLRLPSQKGRGLSWNMTIASDKPTSLPGEARERALKHMIQGQRNQTLFPQGSLLQKLRTLFMNV